MSTFVIELRNSMKKINVWTDDRLHQQAALRPIALPASVAPLSFSSLIWVLEWVFLPFSLPLNSPSWFIQWSSEGLLPHSTVSLISFKILKGILSAYSPNPSGRHPRLCIVYITLWTSFESTCGVPMRWGLCTSIYTQISCKNQLSVHSNSKPKAFSSSQFKTYVCPSRSNTDLMAWRPFFLLFFCPETFQYLLNEWI